MILVYGSGPIPQMMKAPDEPRSPTTTTTIAMTMTTGTERQGSITPTKKCSKKKKVKEKENSLSWVRTQPVIKEKSVSGSPASVFHPVSETAGHKKSCPHQGRFYTWNDKPNVYCIGLLLFSLRDLVENTVYTYIHVQYLHYSPIAIPFISGGDRGTA